MRRHAQLSRCHAQAGKRDGFGRFARSRHADPGDCRSANVGNTRRHAIARRRQRQPGCRRAFAAGPGHRDAIDRDIANRNGIIGQRDPGRRDAQRLDANGVASAGGDRRIAQHQRRHLGIELRQWCRNALYRGRHRGVVGAGDIDAAAGHGDRQQVSGKTADRGELQRPDTEIALRRHRRHAEGARPGQAFPGIAARIECEAAAGIGGRGKILQREGDRRQLATLGHCAARIGEIDDAIGDRQRANPQLGHRRAIIRRHQFGEIERAIGTQNGIDQRCGDRHSIEPRRQRPQRGNAGIDVQTLRRHQRLAGCLAIGDGEIGDDQIEPPRIEADIAHGQHLAGQVLRHPGIALRADDIGHQRIASDHRRAEQRQQQQRYPHQGPAQQSHQFPQQRPILPGHPSVTSLAIRALPVPGHSAAILAGVTGKRSSRPASATTAVTGPRMTPTIAGSAISSPPVKAP